MWRRWLVDLEVLVEGHGGIGEVSQEREVHGKKSDSIGSLQNPRQKLSTTQAPSPFDDAMPKHEKRCSYRCLLPAVGV